MRSHAGAAGAPSVDGFLGGKVTLIQPLSGHRAGLDAALLQSLVPACASGRLVDLGTGVGAVAMSVAARADALSVVGVERDARLVACAQAALALAGNTGFAGRATFVEGDVCARRSEREALGLADGSADWVLMNPPYNDPERGTASPDKGRHEAHVAESGALAAWCRTAAGLLRTGGMLGLIYRASALAELLTAVTARFGAIRILPAHSAADAPAIRILVLARRGSRAGLQILPGLILHEPGGVWTPKANAILRGEADLLT